MVDDLHSHETELEGSRCGPPYRRLKGKKYFWFMGTVNNVWQCGKGAQGPVFTHRVLRKHRAQVGFGYPLHAYVREAATQAGEL